MLEAQVLTLKDPAVKAAKREWNKWQRRRHRKLNLTFDALFELYREYHYRMSDIAEILGITCERACQIYNGCFRELFGGESGKDRKRMADLESRFAKVEQRTAELFAKEKRRALIGKARAAGCEVEAVRRFKKGMLCGVYPNLLLVNGRLCSIHLWTITKKTCGRLRRSYIGVPISYYALMEVEAVLFYTAVPNLPEHVFIVPSALLREKVFGPLFRDTKIVYLPVEKLPVYNNVRPRIDYWEYEDAWQRVLPPKQQDATPAP